MPLSNFEKRSRPLKTDDKILVLHKFCREKQVVCQDCGSVEHCMETFDIYYRLVPSNASECPLSGVRSQKGGARGALGTEPLANDFKKREEAYNVSKIKKNYIV